MTGRAAQRQAQRPASGAEERILDCEAALDRVLLDRRDLDHWNDAWIEPAERWSQAVWDRASELGPLPLSEADLIAAERVARSPAFICGAPRSGTTLVRDLLDGHPQLAVLPAEGKFFRYFGERAAEQDSAPFGQLWLRNLANPNHQRPFWLLGRGDRGAGEYVRFARAFASWHTALEGHEPAARVQATAALAMAREAEPVQRAVDKSPGYEFHLPWIWAHLPGARVIHVVRDPAAVASSCRAGLARIGSPSAPVAPMLRNLANSLLRAAFAVRTAPADRYLLVRYEDLVADRAGQMERVAAFLGIRWDESLLAQTIMGQAAQPNSSFPAEERTAFEPANANERLWLWAATAIARRL